MGYDLTAVDTIRERMGVGYETALAALDEAQGDTVRALAVVEKRQRLGLEELQAQVREGVRRSLTGDGICAVKWSMAERVVAEKPVCLTGVAALAVGLVATLISCSTIETAFTGDRGDGQPGS